MPFRVYDKKKKKFVKDNMLLTPDGELLQATKTMFGNRLSFVSQERYVYQKAIELEDKDGKQIFVGDYLEAQIADDKIVQGLVSYAPELSSYIILCFETDEFFAIGTQVADRIKVVGNVFDEDRKRK